MAALRGRALPGLEDARQAIAMAEEILAAVVTRLGIWP